MNHTSDSRPLIVDAIVLDDSICFTLAPPPPLRLLLMPPPPIPSTATKAAGILPR